MSRFPPCTGQRGATLIDVLVGVGILAIVSFFSFDYILKQQQESKLVDSTVTAIAIQPLIEAYVATSMADFLEKPAIGPNCAAAKGFFDNVMIDRDFPEAGVAIQLARPTNLAPLPPALAGTPTADARNRCLTRTTFASAQSLAGASQVHFCLVVSPVGATSPLKVEPMFAEIFFNMVNVTSGAAVPCETFADDTLNPTRAGRVTYTLHWVDKVSSTEIAARSRRSTFVTSTKMP